MAAGTTPIFVDSPLSPTGRLTTANTARDGSTGTYVALVVAGADGAKYSGFRWISEEDATANNAVRLFLYNGAGNDELLYEGIVPSTTYSSGVTPVPSGGYYPDEGIVLGPSDELTSSVHATDTFGIHMVGGGDF